VVIAGAGFAGFNAAGAVPAGWFHDRDRGDQFDRLFLYLPLMPQVAGGLIELRHIRVSLPRRLRKIRFVLGTADHVDHGQKVVSWTGPEGASGQVGYEPLILTVGSVDKLP
jgi:NADH:ubiquinone reductase (H+-translocating)